MALIECPECKKDISDNVRVCPHCGFKLFNSSSLIGTIIGFLAIFIGFGIMFQSFGISSGFVISFIIALVAAIYGYNKRATPK